MILAPRAEHHDRERIGDATAHIVVGQSRTFAFHPVIPAERRVVRKFRVPGKRRVIR